MPEKIEDIAINYEEDGILLVKEIDKVVLSKGAWSTIIFRYQDWNHSKQEYSEDKYTIRRYRKIGGDYRQQNKFNISGKDQAQKIIDALKGWL